MGAARIQALVQRIAIRQQAQFEDAVAGQGRASLFEQLRHRPARQQADFERAHHFRHVVGMDLRRGRAVEPPAATRWSEPARRVASAQPVAQRLVPRRSGEQPVQQRPQVEAGAAAHNRQSAASGIRAIASRPTRANSPAVNRASGSRMSIR